MRINRGDTTNASQVNLDETRQPREVTDSTVPTAATGGSASDSIALTGVSDLVQLALSAGGGERADRLQQLQQLVETNQYSVDPASVSSALIAAHLSGE
jgi:hypothetical protein